MVVKAHKEGIYNPNLIEELMKKSKEVQPVLGLLSHNCDFSKWRSEIRKENERILKGSEKRKRDAASLVD